MGLLTLDALREWGGSDSAVFSKTNSFINVWFKDEYICIIGPT